jgi:hypothetical protein
MILILGTVAFVFVVLLAGYIGGLSGLLSVELDHAMSICRLEMSGTFSPSLMRLSKITLIRKRGGNL